MRRPWPLPTLAHTVGRLNDQLHRAHEVVQVYVLRCHAAVRGLVGVIGDESEPA